MIIVLTSGIEKRLVRTGPSVLLCFAPGFDLTGRRHSLATKFNPSQAEQVMNSDF